MAGTAILKVDIIGDATKALKAMQQTEDSAGKMGGSFSSVGKVVGAAVGTAAIVGFGKASFAAAEESAQANARLEAVMASMGDTTGQAAKAAEDYASSLSKRIAVDDEVILAGQAQLATFGNVSSETARMAGIFDRATAAGADLAAAGFGTIDSNAVQLGKALEDPTKGMAALAKSGVTFTDAQKDQIKAMQDSGDLLGAQKVVLAAVEKQVGGTAEATVTSSQKMALAFGEVQEEVGAKLLPVVSTLMDLFSRYSAVIIPVGLALVGLVVAVKAYQLAQTLASAATGVWTAIQAVFNVVMAANPILLVVLAIAALVAAVVLAYMKVGWFRDFVDASFDAIVAAFGWVRDAAKAVFNWISDNWPILLTILMGPFGLAIAFVVKNFDSIRDAVAAVFNWVRDNWPLLLAILTGPIGLAVLAVVRNFDTIKDAVTGVYNWIRDKFNAIADFILGVVDRVAGVGSSIADAIKGPLNAVIRGWNGIEFTLPAVDWGPVHVGGQTFGTPNIPTLARGGMVLRTGMALVHEGEQFSGVGRQFGSGQTINITVQTTGLGADAPQIQRAVANALRGYTARNGPLDVPIRGVA
jgi:phage-related protein